MQHNIEIFRTLTIVFSTLIAIIMVGAVAFGLTTNRGGNRRPVILRSNFPVL